MSTFVLIRNTWVIIKALLSRPLRFHQSIALLSLLLIGLTGYGQNLDLVEGFYPILETEMPDSREMFLRGDSTLVYYIAEQPVVSIQDRRDARVDTVSNDLYFVFNEQGTQRLLDFTTNHLGSKIGFVHVGSLRKIYTIVDVIDNGVIEFTSQNFQKVDKPLPGGE